MRLNRLVNLALLTVALAGCGQQTLSGALPSERVGQSNALALPDYTAWADPSTISTPDDPAVLPGAPAIAVDADPAYPGISIVRFAKVSNAMFRGGLPSKSDLVGLKKLGVKTDISLMGDVPVYDTAMVLREKMWAKSAGLKFVQVKIPTGHNPLGGKVKQAHAEAFLKVALDPANQPVYIHCLHGRDRTGTMAAVYKMTTEGITNDQALAYMKTFGFDPKEYPTLAAFVQSYKVPQPALAAN